MSAGLRLHLASRHPSAWLGRPELHRYIVGLDAIPVNNNFQMAPEAGGQHSVEGPGDGAAEVEGDGVGGTGDLAHPFTRKLGE